MKVALRHLLQGILRYKKKLIYGALALFVGQIFLFNAGGIGVQSNVYADNTATQSSSSDEKAVQATDTLKEISQYMYVVLWPIMFLAGKLIDNSWVYGEVFGFDAILWQLWNIVKNLANFCLGGIFIRNILKILRKGDFSSTKDISKLLKNSLIAGVGIQASWFIMAALVDVSTILAYGVGGLPLSVLGNGSKDSDNSYDQYVMKTLVDMDVDSNDTQIILSNATELMSGGKNAEIYYISACDTFTYGGDVTEELIIAPKIIYHLDDETKTPISTDNNKCHFDGQIYYFSSLSDGITWTNVNGLTGEELKGAQITYTDSLKTTKDDLQQKDKDNIKSLIIDGKLLQIGNAHVASGVNGAVFSGISYKDDEKKGLDVNNKWTGEGNTVKLSELLEGSNYLGVFSTLYSSLMDAGVNLRVSQSYSSKVSVALLNSALSAGHMVAIGIPLIVMLVVLIIRIGILWVAIALSPMIVLCKAFNLSSEKALKGVFDSNIVKRLKVDNLIWTIMSPALICFMVSLSTVLVRIIMSLNWENIDTVKEGFLGGLIKLDIAGMSIALGRIICSIIAIVIMRFLMRAALSLAKMDDIKIIKNMKDFAGKAIGSAQVVPIPGKDGKMHMIGINDAFGLNGREGILDRVSEQLKTNINEQNEEAVKRFINTNEQNEEVVEKGKEKSQLDAYSSIFNNGSISPDWQTSYKTEGGLTFDHLSYDNKMKIIEKINDLNEDRKPEVMNPITMKDKDGKDVTYNWEGKKYVIKDSSSIDAA